MRKIFHFDSPDGPVRRGCRGALLFRSIASVRSSVSFCKKQNIHACDMIIVAGGAKTLASPRNDFEQDFILEQVRMSIRLHQTKRVLVMSHSDCATYGGLAHFKGDREAEAIHHRGEFLRAAELLTTNFAESQSSRTSSNSTESGKCKMRRERRRHRRSGPPERALHQSAKGLFSRNDHPRIPQTES